MAESKPIASNQDQEVLSPPPMLNHRYKISGTVGQGGMAIVFLADDIVLKRQVAIKFLRPRFANDNEAVMRFFREAKAAKLLRHPNVVEIFDVGKSDGSAYIVMEYVKGKNLKDYIANHKPIPVGQAVEIMKKLTSAIIEAHAHHIIHRDIKPQNVLVSQFGDLKIADFGIAVTATEQNSTSITRNQAVMGSSHYLAPESATGAIPDYRVDIYALGIVFFELLCGSVPFNGKTAAEIAIKHMQDPLPNIHAYNPTVTQGVENVVIKATAKSPDERYQTAQEFMDALDHCLDPEMRYVEPLELKVKKIDFPRTPEPPVQNSEPEKEDQDIPQISHIEKPQKISKRFMVLVGGIVALCCLFIITSLMATGVFPINGWFGWHKVPTVTGLSQDEAIQTLVAAGIEPQNIYIEQVASDLVDPGYADSTNIVAGEYIKESPVTVRISKGPTFLVGDYRGQPLANVEKLFHDHNLNIIIDTTEQGDANHMPGVILEQSGLAPGLRIDPSKLETIHFVVSTYPTLTIDESYIGMDIDEAKEVLNNQGMAVLTRNVYGTQEVIDIDPPVGTTYTQEGSDSVITLYY
ncbi:MAG: Stk1 family PASTA domain-containing Ser/Thr kinase [Allobaculum sp.]|nr:Stk1 family PASTA domain-containing Ser/Thr kinase [Allobaculum sp.]